MVGKSVSVCVCMMRNNWNRCNASISRPSNWLQKNAGEDSKSFESVFAFYESVGIE